MKNPKNISSCMKRNVIFAHAGTTVGEAVSLMVDKKVGTLPVVDDVGKLVGMTTISDIAELFLPNFVALLDDIDFVKDYGKLKSPSQKTLDRLEILTLAEIMEEPVAVEDHSSLIRALSTMHKHNLADLPIIQNGKLVGIASRVDIFRAFFADWRPAARPEGG